MVWNEKSSDESNLASTVQRSSSHDLAEVIAKSDKRMERQDFTCVLADIRVGTP